MALILELTGKELQKKIKDLINDLKKQLHARKTPLQEHHRPNVNHDINNNNNNYFILGWLLDKPVNWLINANQNLNTRYN